jgi:hypothetical protein
LLSRLLYCWPSPAESPASALFEDNAHLGEEEAWQSIRWEQGHTAWGSDVAAVTSVFLNGARESGTLRGTKCHPVVLLLTLCKEEDKVGTQNQPSFLTRQ